MGVRVKHHLIQGLALFQPGGSITQVIKETGKSWKSCGPSPHLGVSLYTNHERLTLRKPVLGNYSAKPFIITSSFLIGTRLEIFPNIIHIFTYSFILY